MNGKMAGVLVWFVAACLLAGTGALTAQSESTGAWDEKAWDEEAAAGYLDQRQSWWAGWPVAARDEGTYCISCHTVVPYALARPHLREGSDAKPSEIERGLLANVSQRVREWQDLAPEGDQARGTESVLNTLVLASSDARTGKLGDDTRLAFDHLWATQARTGDLEGAWPWFVVDLQPWESDDAPYYGASLAALAAFVLAPVTTWYLSGPGHALSGIYQTDVQRIEFASFLALVIVLRYRDNILRLARGEEDRIGAGRSRSDPSARPGRP